MENNKSLIDEIMLMVENNPETNGHKTLIIKRPPKVNLDLGVLKLEGILDSLTLWSKEDNGDFITTKKLSFEIKKNNGFHCNVDYSVDSDGYACIDVYDDIDTFRTIGHDSYEGELTESFLNDVLNAIKN
jgi:hypothetical protein